MLGYSGSARDAADLLPDTIHRAALEELGPRTADALLVSDLPDDTTQLARILDRAAAGSTTIVEFEENKRRSSEWKDVFQALGFRIRKLDKSTGRLRAVLYKTVPASRLRKWTVVIPRVHEEQTFERLFEWISFFQRFDSIQDTELLLVEDSHLHGNEAMLRNLSREGFFLRKRHFRPFGLFQTIATGFHFASGKKVMVDTNPEIPVEEVQGLLVESYTDRIRPYVLSGRAVQPDDNLKRRSAVFFGGFFSRILPISLKKRLQFALFSGDSARMLENVLRKKGKWFRIKSAAARIEFASVNVSKKIHRGMAASGS